MDRDLISALKTLTDARRLRVVAALAADEGTVEEIGQRLGSSPASVAHHLARLRQAGIVEVAGGWPQARFRLRTERLNELGRSLDELEHAADDSPPDVLAPGGRDLSGEEMRILGGYFAADRLTAIPAQERKRLVVLRYLRDRCFPDDREYPEKEVNQRLAVFHPDPASLRRYLVDSGLMTRAAGRYRRAA